MIQRHHAEADTFDIPQAAIPPAIRAVSKWAERTGGDGNEILAMLGIDENPAPLRSSDSLKRKRRRNPTPGTPLTPGERETLRAIQDAGTTAGVHETLGVHDGTLFARLARIRSKLGVACNADLLELDIEAVA